MVPAKGTFQLVIEVLTVAHGQILGGVPKAY
ncbi:hypothetical protein EDC40_103396 [Aminobacter aminovorans]|uniref:Uncharacterized protein n=1 Tax=Aminobacter aminovorans TaxID=83263 RepID=A0A380WKU2_AMIAI|nr:hypothetical protein EDC40_103396 [Aminobacter aminovorans]SUU89659.1 Uncharacterised protein [Aminobacter aminovorans]